ncbi:hypothetical protein BC833DRAFT_616469 [Globomyces pollinis-pini]|nr:hypothetical protein BC833DRAFT_616469 [Globomyces pollinis-pini]
MKTNGKSKKIPDTEVSRKKQKLKDPKLHSASCNDSSCVGCDVGQVDIELVSKDGLPLTPLDYYVAAKEELTKLSTDELNDSGIDPTSIVTKLFEMAITQYESNSIVDLSYCNCLYDFGLFLHVGDYFIQAESQLEKYLKSSVVNSKDVDAWLLLALVYIQLAKLSYNLDSSDIDEDLVLADVTEQNYLKRSICSFKKAHELNPSGKSKVNLVAANALLEHALLQKSHHIVPNTIKFTLQNAFKFGEAAEPSTRTYRIQGTCLFHLASMESHLKDSNLQNAVKDAKNAIELLKQVTSESDSKASDYQLLGQAWLLLSSLETEDDDAAIVAFDLGAESLQNALRIDPENHNIRQQLIDMELIEDNEESS